MRGARRFAARAARSSRSSGAAPLNLRAGFSCAKRGRPISSSSVAGAARTTPTPGLSCFGPAGPFCWCPTPSLRCRVAAWKDTRECRRAVRDALPFLQQAKEVLLVEVGEDESRSQAKKNLADVAAYLVRHRVIVAAEVWRRPRGPAAAELLHVVKEEKADLIVAGGYGHSRLGEWIFGGVTRELLSA